MKGVTEEQRTQSAELSEAHGSPQSARGRIRLLAQKNMPLHALDDTSANERDVPPWETSLKQKLFEMGQRRNQSGFDFS